MELQKAADDFLFTSKLKKLFTELKIEITAAALFPAPFAPHV